MGTGEGEEELLDNCSVGGERGAARPEETSLDNLHPSAPAPGVTRRYETLVVRKEQAQTGHIAAACNGEGIDGMARATAVEAE